MHIHSHLFPKAAHCFRGARRTIYRSASYRGVLLKGLATPLKFILQIALLRRGFRRECLPPCARMVIGKHRSAGRQRATSKKAWGRVGELRSGSQPSAVPRRSPGSAGAPEFQGCAQESPLLLCNASYRGSWAPTAPAAVPLLLCPWLHCQPCSPSLTQWGSQRVRKRRNDRQSVSIKGLLPAQLWAEMLNLVEERGFKSLCGLA